MIRRFLASAGIILAGCTATGGTTTATAGGAFAAKGIPWTIRCLELQGAFHQQQVEQLADTLRHTPGIRAADVTVQNDGDGFSRLYYGTYFLREDKKGNRPFTPQLRKDLDFIRSLGDKGQHYFLRALPVIKPTPDVGNPQWRLASVKAAYSLQVAAFVPTDTFFEFKQAAAEYCKLLRDSGHEAYYHHTDSMSMVTVGAFGPESVILDASGHSHYSEKVKSLQQNELLKHNLLNGRIYRVPNDKGQRVPVGSLLVEVPKTSQNLP